MGFQYFGTIETPQGNASATLCVDDDSPMEFMIQWYGAGINAGGVLTTSRQDGGAFELVPRLLYRVGSNGGLFAPLQLTQEEITWMTGTKGVLRETAAGLDGEWTGPNGTKGHIVFSRPHDPPERVVANKGVTRGHRSKHGPETCVLRHNTRRYSEATDAIRSR